MKYTYEIKLKAVKLIKKGILIDELRHKYKLKILLKVANIKKST